MTTGQDIERFVNARAEYGLVTLTQIFTVHRPVHLIGLGYDEIAFRYADGSEYVTGLSSNEEYMEFEALRTLLEESR